MRRLPALPDNPFFVRSAALLTTLVALVGSFAAYVSLEKRVDAINAQRQQSLLLMDELRQSSHDLTQLARSYAATGQDYYRRHFDEVMAIREGRQARPERYYGIYWDLVLADGPRPRPMGKDHTPLLERMRQAGFTATELALLNDSKQRSDHLTRLENRAMDLAASGQLSRASVILFGEEYDRAKAAILQPIDAAFVSMDERTRAALSVALRDAFGLRLVVIALGVLSMAMLVSLYRAARRTLGGSLDEIHDAMHALAQGKFDAAPAARSQDSVLGWLGQMQRELRAADEGKREATQLVQESLDRLNKIARMVPGVVHVLERRKVDGHMCFPYASEGLMRLYGLDPAQVRDDASPLLATLHPNDLLEALESMKASARAQQPWQLEYRVRHAIDGTERWLFSNGVPERQPDGSVRWYGYTDDVTERRRAAEESRIGAIAFETKEGMLVTDAAGRILRVNGALSALSGYTLADLAGKSPQLLHAAGGDPALEAARAVAIGRHGTWEGEIQLRRKDGSEVPVLSSVTAVRGTDGAFSHYVHMYVDNSERKAREELVRQLAYFDSLTGLPNRRMLMDRLQQAVHASRRSGRHGALCFIDLDRFKALNDNHGHEVGDRLLQQVAQRLQDAVRSSDTVARLGGDEFVLVLQALDEHPDAARRQAQAIGGKVLAALAALYLLDGLEWSCSGSIGMALFGLQAAEPDVLLKQADIAMYEAKKAGRNALRTYCA